MRTYNAEFVGRQKQADETFRPITAEVRAENINDAVRKLCKDFDQIRELKLNEVF